MKHIAVFIGIFALLISSTVARATPEDEDNETSIDPFSALDLKFENTGLKTRRGLFSSDSKLDPNPSSNPNNWQEDLGKEIANIVKTTIKLFTDFVKNRNPAEVTTAALKIGQLVLKLGAVIPRIGLQLMKQGYISAFIVLLKTVFAFGKSMLFSS